MKVHIKVKGTQVKLPGKERKNEHAKRRAENSLRPHISRPCCDPTQYAEAGCYYKKKVRWKTLQIQKI